MKYNKEFVNEGFELQLFADDNSDGDDGSNNTGDDNKQTYTQEEFEAELQAESDRRVTEALKKQERKMNKKLKEAEKLRNMSDEQQKQYKLEQREKELDEKEKQYALMENKVECSNILSDRGLPKEFLEYVVAEDAEQMLENINKMDRAFKAAVSDEVNKKIGKKTPRGGNDDKQSGMTKEKFKKLSVAQQSEIYKTNPELWKKMVD